jgi:tetrathionate reductase subunit B
MTEISRRGFLGAVSALVMLPAVSAVPHVESGKRYAMLIDVDKCYGCMACVIACAAENNVPLGSFRTWVEQLVQA